MTQPLISVVKPQPDDRMRAPAMKRLQEIVAGAADGEPINPGPELEAFRQAYLDIKTGFGVIITLHELEKFTSPERWFLILSLLGDFGE